MEPETIADDRLVGAEAIAKFRGERVRRTRYLIERGELPHGREGTLIVASKRALREHCADSERRTWAQR
jgi:hypothetical protein